MSTVSITLPEPLKAFAEEQATKRGFDSSDAFLSTLLGELLERQARAELEAKLLEGLRSPAIRLTEEFWQEKDRKYSGGLAETDQP